MGIKGFLFNLICHFRAPSTFGSFAKSLQIVPLLHGAPHSYFTVTSFLVYLVDIEAFPSLFAFLSVKGFPYDIPWISLFWIYELFWWKHVISNYIVLVFLLKILVLWTFWECITTISPTH